MVTSNYIRRTGISSVSKLRAPRVPHVPHPSRDRSLLYRASGEIRCPQDFEMPTRKDKFEGFHEKIVSLRGGIFPFQSGH